MAVFDFCYFTTIAMHMVNNKKALVDRSSLIQNFFCLLLNKHSSFIILKYFAYCTCVSARVANFRCSMDILQLTKS